MKRPPLVSPCLSSPSLLFRCLHLTLPPVFEHDASLILVSRIISCRSARTEVIGR